MPETNKLNKIFNSLPKQRAIEFMKESNNINDYLGKIGQRQGGSGYRQFYCYCSKYNIDYKQHLKYEERSKININKTTEEILVENSTYYSTNHLKKRLFRENILEEKCVLCGNNGTWMGKKLSLQLDHINGIHNDNRLENLRILCPNCHAQTDTFCGKNVKPESKIEKKKYYCSICNIKETSGLNKNCPECYSIKNRKVKDRPSIETLEEELKTTSYLQLGKKYGVSDNAIRKWMGKRKTTKKKPETVPELQREQQPEMHSEPQPEQLPEPSSEIQK